MVITGGVTPLQFWLVSSTVPVGSKAFAVDADLCGIVYWQKCRSRNNPYEGIDLLTTREYKLLTVTTPPGFSYFLTS